MRWCISQTGRRPGHQGPIRVETRPRSPKLHPVRTKPPAYRYYAGFSPDFVRDVIVGLSLGPTDLLVDPWNGSGTTTTIAEELGIPSWGGDVNPAMIVIAKARLLGSH